MFILLVFLVVGLASLSMSVMAKNDNSNAGGNSDKGKSDSSNSNSGSSKDSSSNDGDDSSSSSESKGKSEDKSNDNAGKKTDTGNEDSSQKEEVTYTDDAGNRITVVSKNKTKDGETEVVIERKIKTPEGDEIVIKEKIEKKDGEEKIVRTIEAKGANVSTDLSLKEKRKENKTILEAELSNGEGQDIVLDSDEALLLAFDALNASDNFSVELQEQERNGKKVAVFAAKAKKEGKFLGLFSANLDIETIIDPETGEVLETNRPWWSFLVKKEEKVDVCHVTGDGNKTVVINIAPQAVKAHLAHGDALGNCEAPSPVCGDGILDPEVEMCDDGNTLDGDGCSSLCEIEMNETNDTMAPQWFNASTNTTLANSLINHSVSWTDDVGLSDYIFSFDNGNGTFVNDSSVSFGGVQNISSVVKYVFDPNISLTIRWRVYAFDTTGNLNVTDLFSYNTTGEVTPPTNETNETDDTLAPRWFGSAINFSAETPTIINHSLTWTDDVGLSSYIFSLENGSGVYVNDSPVTFTGTQNRSTVIKVVDLPVGTRVRWKVYANDTSNNFNGTGFFTYFIQSPANSS